MHLRERSRVTVRIQHDTKKGIEKGLGSSSSIRSIDRIRMSEIMKARLSSPESDAFRYDPDPEQSFPLMTEGERYRELVWDVTPIEAGTKVLKLSVTTSIHVDGLDRPAQVEVFQKDIRVTVKPSEALSYWWEKNWKLVIGP